MLTAKKAELNLDVRSDHSFVKFFMRLHKVRKGTQNSKDIWSIEEMIVQWMLNSIFLDLACFEAPRPLSGAWVSENPVWNFPSDQETSPISHEDKRVEWLPERRVFPGRRNVKTAYGVFSSHYLWNRDIPGGYWTIFYEKELMTLHYLRVQGERDADWRMDNLFEWQFKLRC